VIVLGIPAVVLVFLHARSFEKSCVDYLYFEFVEFEVILCMKVGFCPVVVSQFQSLVVCTVRGRVSQDKSYQSRNGTHTELIGHCP
jgi:hypothetical protein